jgi:hypothetical protein
MLVSPVEGDHRKTSGLRPAVVRKVDDDRRCRAAYDNPSKRLKFRRVDFHMREQRGNMNEIAGLGDRGEFSCGAPANLAVAGENVCNRILLAVMMNSGPRSRHHLEHAAPDGRSDTQRWRDRGAAFRARGLRRSAVEFGGADNSDCGGALMTTRSVQKADTRELGGGEADSH